MPDYFLRDSFAAKLGLASEELQRFEARGVIHSVGKQGRTYYSSQDFYRLKAILHLTRNKGLTLEDAQARVTRRPGLVLASGR